MSNYPQNRLQSRSVGAIRGGTFYTAEALDAALLNGADLDMLIRTPDLPVEVTLSMSVAATGAGELILFENPTVTADGTGLAEVNHNRQSSKTAAVATFSGPTLTADGTRLVGYPSGTELAGGGLVPEGWEMILARNEEYLLRFTNLSGGNVSVSLKAHFNEDASRG